MRIDIEKVMMYLYNKVIKLILKNKSEYYLVFFFMFNFGYWVEWKINILDFVFYFIKINIGYNIVWIGIISFDNVVEMFGFFR